MVQPRTQGQARGFSRSALYVDVDLGRLNSTGASRGGRPPEASARHRAALWGPGAGRDYRRLAAAVMPRCKREARACGRTVDVCIREGHGGRSSLLSRWFVGTGETRLARVPPGSFGATPRTPRCPLLESAGCVSRSAPDKETLPVWPVARRSTNGEKALCCQHGCGTARGGPHTRPK